MGKPRLRTSCPHKGLETIQGRIISQGEAGLPDIDLITQTLNTHCVAVYSTHDEAEAALNSLKDSGFDVRNLSIVGQDFQSEETPVGYVNTGDRIWSWGKYGAFWGTVWGILFGSAFLIFPGVGPVIFAGYIVSVLEGTLAGSALGALGCVFASLGVPDNTVLRYEADLRAGSFLLIAHGTPQEVQGAKELLPKTQTLSSEIFTTNNNTAPVEPIAKV